jgi:prephenate dehydratase
VRVAFLGPAGTYSEEALRALAPAGADEIPHPTVHDAVMAVQEGAADAAVVPIENSLEGSVAATLDALAGEAGDVCIAAELVHPIRHCLIARERLDPADVERVVSHPHAIAQCARFLRERLPAAERASAASTAEAVRTVAASAGPWAAIGGRLAAELYGCAVLADAIDDEPGNLTRFVLLSPREAAPMGGGASGGADPAAPWKTSIVFWGFNDEAPGALVGVLSELSDRGINMTKIESRPRRVRLGRYMFFADLDGAADSPPVDEALEALRGRVRELRVLGSYPAAPEPAEQVI